MVNQERNGAIDLFRLIVSMAIVSVHWEGTYGPYKLLAGTFGRLGVPFFLLVTGYFYFSKKNQILSFNFVTSWKYIKKMFILWIIWTVIYSYRMVNMHFSGADLIRILWGPNSYSSILWYLIAACEGLLIVHFVAVKFNQKSLVVIFIVSFVLCLLGSGYGELVSGIPNVQKIIEYLAPQTSFFAAIVWYCVALFLVKNLKRIQRYGNIKILALFIMFWAGEFVFIHVKHLMTANDMYVMLVPVSLVLFCYLLNHPIYFPSKIDRLFCDLSLYVYLVQNIAGDLVSHVILRGKAENFAAGPLYLPLILIVDVLLSLLVLGVVSFYKAKIASNVRPN